jgi:hypothetical protein
MIVRLQQIPIGLVLALGIASQAGAQSLEHRLTSSQSKPPITGPAIAVSAPRSPVAEDSSKLAVRDLEPHDLSSLSSKNDQGGDGQVSFEKHEPTLRGIFLLHATRTPFMTEARVPIAQTTGARFQLSFVFTSMNNRNLMLGPGAPPDAGRFLGQPRSTDLYGVSVSIPLGRDAAASGSKGLAQVLSGILRGR